MNLKLLLVAVECRLTGMQVLDMPSPLSGSAGLPRPDALATKLFVALAEIRSGSWGDFHHGGDQAPHRPRREELR